MGCLEGDRPPEEQIQQLRQLVENAPEPSVRPYLEESACAFAIGAYSAAIVAGWCAVARYLRLLVDVMGEDVGRRYYRDEKNGKTVELIPKLEEWDGRPLLKVCDRMQVLPKGSFRELHLFWKQRCDYAHPSDNFAGSKQAFELMIGVQWLLIRSIDQEWFQDHVVLIECAEDKQFSLDQRRARELVGRLCENQCEPLARWVLRKRLSLDRKVSNGRLLALWEALKPRLSEDSCSRLMKEILDPLLADFLAFKEDQPEEQPPVVDEVIDVVQMAQFVFWNEVCDLMHIWEYFAQRLKDDLMNRRVAAQLKRYAPSPYRERVEAIWPNV